LLLLSVEYRSYDTNDDIYIILLFKN